jgi:hypothetical protein
MVRPCSRPSSDCSWPGWATNDQDRAASEKIDTKSATRDGGRNMQNSEVIQDAVGGGHISGI